MRAAPMRSWGRNLSPISSEKIGTVAWAIPAAPESMCCSPQAISQNGAAALRSPSAIASRHASRSRTTAVRVPIVAIR